MFIIISFTSLQLQSPVDNTTKIGNTPLLLYLVTSKYYLLCYLFWLQKLGERFQLSEQPDFLLPI